LVPGVPTIDCFHDGGRAVHEADDMGGLGVAARAALAGRLAGRGVLAFQLLAAPFRTGLPWRLGAACGAVTGSRDAAQRK